MAYDLQWGSANPGHLVYLLDFSGSMEDEGKIDTMLDVLKETCIEMFADEKNLTRASLSIIGYNTDVATLYKGTIKDLYNKFLEGGGRKYTLLDKTKSILEGGCRPEFQTYTAKAFRWVKKDIEEWITERKQGGKGIPAPMVIHITDGYPYEEERSQDIAMEDALKAAQEIMNISIPDGSPLIFNIHIGDDQSKEVLFPTERLSEENQQFLYDASSIIPCKMLEAKVKTGLPISSGCRLMASNVKDKGNLANLILFGSLYVHEAPKPH